MYVTSMVTVQHYFDSKRAMATGIAVSGSGVGTLVFGIVTMRLINSVEWRWTLRIQAVLILIGALCGVMYRPLPDEYADLESSNQEEQTFLITESQEKYGGTESTGAQGVVNKQKAEQHATRGCCSQIVSNYFASDLFKNPIFYLVCFSVVMFCFGYHVPYTYTPGRAQHLDVNSTQSSFLVSIMGIANVVSRLAFGWIGKKMKEVRWSFKVLPRRRYSYNKIDRLIHTYFFAIW